MASTNCPNASKVGVTERPPSGEVGQPSLDLSAVETTGWQSWMHSSRPSGVDLWRPRSPGLGRRTTPGAAFDAGGGPSRVRLRWSEPVFPRGMWTRRGAWGAWGGGHRPLKRRELEGPPLGLQLKPTCAVSPVFCGAAAPSILHGAGRRRSRWEREGARSGGHPSRASANHWRSPPIEPLR